MESAVDLARVVFSGLSALVIEDVTDEDGLIEVWARTRGGEAACTGCGVLSRRVHAWFERTVSDVPVDGRRVLVRVWARRMRCSAEECAQATFREQVPGVIERYQRRTTRLTRMIEETVRELAGRAAARLAPSLGVGLSRDSALRALLRIPLSPAQIPEVIGVDDFALRRRHTYATVIIDAVTGRRIDVVEGRRSEILTCWLHAHPGAQVVCRDGSAAYAEGIRAALPDAVQVADRWHLWHGLAEKVQKEVAAHSACWTPQVSGLGMYEGKRAQTTMERWQQVHDLLDAGVGLGDAARRLGIAMNTVKRYARATKPEHIRRPPKYRPTLVDPYRDYLRQRRAEQAGVATQQLLREIREQGYEGSSNLLVRYLNQGRADNQRPHLSPRRASGLVLTRPEALKPHDVDTLDKILTACPEMASLAALVRSFAALLDPAEGNDDLLSNWMTTARTADLPHMHAFVRGLEIDRAAVDAALTMPFHNGRTEGVNNKTKLIKRQMYGRAGFELLRHRILLG